MPDNLIASAAPASAPNPTSLWRVIAAARASILGPQPVLLLALALLLALLGYQPHFGAGASLAASPSNIALRGVYAVEGA
ncbi:MAG: hypothetical protein H7Y32_18830, partial [Chloroflexales bacterium]|nr:hypothetical protein [Chloroflexales bacterium]